MKRDNPPQTVSIAREYLRPWKLVTLALGIGLLIVGSFYYDAPDWDIPISLIMASLTYLTAAPALRVILERRWRWVPLALIAAWFSIDGCYWLYWRFRSPGVLPLMRDANFFASSALYGICGLVWLYRGTLRQFVRDTRSILARTSGANQGGTSPTQEPKIERIGKRL